MGKYIVLDCREPQLPPNGSILSALNLLNVFGGGDGAVIDGAPLARQYGISPIIAFSQKLKNEAYRIRHAVYCEELEYEECRPDGLEKDSFDEHSLHCLIGDNVQKSFVGAIRLVYLNNKAAHLPLLKIKNCSFYPGAPHPSMFSPETVCEVSRLSVLSDYRAIPIGKGVNLVDSLSLPFRLKSLPFAAAGLYLTSIVVAVRAGLTNMFVIMEPRLARSFKLLGINFQQTGPLIDFHGKRAPYYIDASSALAGVPAEIKVALRGLIESTEHQLNGQLAKL